MLEENGRLTDEEYQIAYSLVPRTCLDLILKNHHGEIVLTFREIDPHKGKWHLPGGRLKKDETVTQAAERISKAELGLKVSIGDLTCVGYMEFIPDGQLPNGVSLHSISLVFAADLLSGELEGSLQAKTIKSFKPSEIPTRENMLPQHYDFLQKLINQSLI